VVTALLVSTLAQASDVGTSKRIGVGVATGPGILDATGKYYLNDKMGISAYLGTSFSYHMLRGNFEMEFVELADWDFARMDMYWDAGIDLGLHTAYGFVDGQFGLGGGVGVELQFHEVPAHVFVDVGLGVNPLNFCDIYEAPGGFCLIAPRGAAGGRWYF
jgi:hypothetical protein